MASRSTDALGARGWGLAVLAASACFAAVASAHPPDRARTEALARRATERLQALQHEADRLAAEERSVLNDVTTSEIERQIRAEEVKKLGAEGAKLQSDLDEAVARMTALEQSWRVDAPQVPARL